MSAASVNWGTSRTAAGHVPHREIHLASRVGEHSVAEQPLEQAVGFALRVAPFDADEHEQPALDGADAYTVHVHGGASHSLQQSDHGASG